MMASRQLGINVEVELFFCLIHFSLVDKYRVAVLGVEGLNNGRENQIIHVW